MEKELEIEKIAVYGRFEVGSTRFAYKFMLEENKDYYEILMRYDFVQRWLEVDGRKHCCRLFDIYNNPEDVIPQMNSFIFQECTGFIFAYSATDLRSFDELSSLFDKIKQEKKLEHIKDIPFIIIETKSDASGRAVTLKEGMEFAALYNVPFFSTSAKTGENVVNAVEEIVRQMRDKREGGKKKSKNKNYTKQNIPDSTVVIQAPPSTLVNDIQTHLFNVAKYSDLTIIVGDKSIYVHKAILFSRSPSFMEKLQATDTTMDLPNLSYSAVLSIVKYLYTGKFVRENNVTRDEYEMAIMKLEIYYLLPILKEVPEEIEEFVPQFQRLFNLNFSSDLKITVKETKEKEREIFCHKMILCARSEYFRVMYQSGFREIDSPEMIVDDCSYEAILFLIKYYYLDVNEIEDETIVLDLLKVAHRYNELPLLRIIEKFLTKKLSVENVCAVLPVCDVFSLATLKQVCLEFVAYRFGKVAKTSAFKKLSADLQKELKSEQKEGLWQIPKMETEPNVLTKLLKSFIL